MQRRLKSSLLILFFAFMVLSCTPDGETDRTINEPAASGGWTIMVWLDGDNNLETFSLADFNEMEYGLYVASQTDAAATDKVKIIVQVDRHSGYDNSTAYTGKDWSDTRRYIIRPDSALNNAWSSQRIDNDMGEANMGDAAELRDFIEYCHEHFPADNYALIMWNHGGGLMKKKSYSADVTSTVITDTPSKNICIDDTDDDQLYTGEITDVLTDAHSVGFLGFDACLMGMLEVAYEYRPGETGKFGAEAICFSPAEEQADGWDYVRILTRLKGSGSDDEGDTCYDASSAVLTPQVFAELCAKEYADNKSTYDSLQTQTAVDNTKVTAVKTAMDAFAVAIYNASPLTYKTTIEGIRGSGTSTVTMNYFNEALTGSYDQWDTWPYFDLYDFALRLKNSSLAGVNGDTGKAADLMSAINAFIRYSYGGGSYKGYTSGAADSAGNTAFIPGSNGLSFFFTDGDASYGDGTYLAYQWWYTSLDTNTWRPPVSGVSHLYGKIDFCSGDGDGVVDNWFELIMAMYHDGDYVNTHPGPAY